MSLKTSILVKFGIGILWYHGGNGIEDPGKSAIQSTPNFTSLFREYIRYLNNILRIGLILLFLHLFPLLLFLILTDHFQLFYIRRNLVCK